MADDTVPDQRRPSPDSTLDLAGALHEVSNALTVVHGWLARAREGGTPEEVRHALDVAWSRAGVARGIVRRAIGAEAAVEPCQTVGSVIDAAVDGVLLELERARLSAERHAADLVQAREVPHGYSVLQILTNLLLNAAAMAPPGSTVRVEADGATNGRVVFSVSDRGPGIPEARRGTLFEAGVSTRAGGAGIGLRHAAALARSFGGELTLASCDEGARFELVWTLLATRAAPEEPAAPRRPRSLHGTRVLLVEDDDAVIDLLDTVLTTRGAEVVSVRHPRELPAALSTGRFDAALFDLSPIQDDVRGVLARARGESAALRVVVISGSAVALPALPDEWVSAWVRKPFDVAEILQAIEPSGHKT